MKKLTIGAIVAAMTVASIANAQDNTTPATQTTSTIYSGPWMLRKSTGNKTHDRVWFIMDRTLNSCEQDTLRTMFRTLPEGTSYVIEKAMAGAIDTGAKSYPTYGTWWSGDWQSDNGMSDLNVYNAMRDNTDSVDRGILGAWLTDATDSQLSAVAKLVRLGGYSNIVWTNSGMNQ